MSRTTDRIAPDHAVVVDADRAAVNRLDAERVEQVAADGHSETALSRLIGAIGQADDDDSKRNEGGEAPRLVAHVFIVRVRQRCRRGTRETRLGNDGRDGDDLARTGNGERAEHQRVREAEHRGVGAHANRDRQHRDEREARILP